MNTAISREQKIESMRHDFLDRDKDSYVRIRRTGRLGWESLIPQGGNYSDLLRDCCADGDIIREAYTMARDYIVAMDTPYRVTLRLSPEMNCTDSKVVYLSTRVFDDRDLSAGQQIDTFVGLAIHEGCHLKWTDFTQMAEAPNAIVRNLINLIEDERIERLCGEHMPGYANYLKATKYYMFDLYASRMLKKNPGNGLPAHIRLLNAILSVVRYPKALQEADLQEFADYLYEVRGILENFPATREEVDHAANAIYDVIRKFYEEQKSNDKNDNRQEQEEESGTEEDGTENSSEQDGSDGDNPQDEDATKGRSSQQEEPDTESGSDEKTGNGPETKCRTEEDPGEDDQAGCPCSEEIEKALEELAGEMGDILSTLASEPDGGQQPMGREDMAASVRKDSGKLAGICENCVTLGLGSNSVLYRAPENGATYDDSLRAVRRYIPAIAGALKNHCREYQVTYRGMRSGLLDVSKIAEAYQGVQNVYVREGSVKSNRMAVCVLIDESGSMYGEKINAARNLAVLLNEAVSSVPGIDLYIYGHTYGDRCRDSYREGKQITELQLYREKGYAPRKSLGSIEARSGNLDSFAIREAAARMMKFTASRQNLMFVITDGAPNEKYEQLASTVRQLEKQGMNIVAVCIEPSYDPSQLYTHHVTLTDMNTLAFDLGKMIKKAILRNAGSREE